MDQKSRDPSTSQLSYIEKVRRLIEDLKKPGDFVSMSEILGKLMDLIRSSLEGHPIRHQREVNYFSNFRAIMEGDLPEDTKEMFTILEYMGWALYRVVARAASQGVVGHTEPKEIRTVLKLVPNASMNGSSDGEATRYWMRRPAHSHQEAVSLNEFSSQSIRLPSQADSHQEDKHPDLGKRLCWRRGKDKIGCALKQLAYALWPRQSQRWTDDMRDFVYDLKGEDSADVLQQVIRKFPELVNVDIDELEGVRSQCDSPMYHDKLFD